MPHDLMLECDRRTRYKVDGQIELRWKKIPVSELEGSVSSGDIRCTHCWGAVRVHKQKVAHGPQDHVEHRSRQDSEGCKGGDHFQGTHRTSSHPVV
jgi:hypothetical protein